MAGQVEEKERDSKTRKAILKQGKQCSGAGRKKDGRMSVQEGLVREGWELHAGGVECWSARGRRRGVQCMWKRVRDESGGE